MYFNNYPFFANVFLGNSFANYFTTLTIFLAVLIILKIFQIIIISRIKKFAKKTKNDFDDILVDGIYAIRWPFYVVIALNIAIQFIIVNDFFKKVLYFVLLTTSSYYAISMAQKFINHLVEIISIKKKEENQDAGIIRFIGSIAKFALWCGAILLIISNLGFNIMSLVAGLGIGGIAIALALQNILGDLFSSVSIYFDKPFKIGDFIYIGNKGGTVKSVGIKTTRIEMLQGEELVVSNTEITKTQIRNYGKMKRRRVVINIGVTYDTPSEKLKRIPDLIKEIIGKHKLIEINRVFFTTFGDSALIYEIVLYANTSEYSEYLKIQNDFNIKLIEEFEKENIEFAYPTQTLYIKK